jgi:hypothetical protein
LPSSTEYALISKPLVLIYSAGEARGKVCPMSEASSVKALWVLWLIKMLMMLSVNNPNGRFRL